MQLRTLVDRDKLLEEMWADMDPETEVLEEPFIYNDEVVFPTGTEKLDIWRWFDQRHSKGVAHLLYGDGVDRTDALAQLVSRNAMCRECGTTDCAFWADGLCKYPLVHGRQPEITEEDGCKDGVYPDLYYSGLYAR
ncbi:MAG: hypothetical protein LUB63_03110 [Oscillospiraceae bacterium]|nr:hypothetical protein [Oscillospiraceae bacterium]